MKDHITPVTGRNSLTPNIVFTWRFAECQENKATYHHVTAHTEDEARSLLPGLLLVFTARIRQGGELCLMLSVLILRNTKQV